MDNMEIELRQRIIIKKTNFIKTMIERHNQNLNYTQIYNENNLSKITFDINQYKDVDDICTKHVVEYTKEDQHAIYFRYIFLVLFGGYFYLVNYYASTVNIFKEDSHLFWIITIHNISLLLVPVASFFKSYGDRNKSSYVPPNINTAIDKLLRMKKDAKDNFEKMKKAIMEKNN